MSRWLACRLAGWPASQLAGHRAGRRAGQPAGQQRTRKDWKTYGQGPERTRKEIGNFSLTRDFRIKDQRIPALPP